MGKKLTNPEQYNLDRVGTELICHLFGMVERCFRQLRTIQRNQYCYFLLFVVRSLMGRTSFNQQDRNSGFMKDLVCHAAADRPPVVRKGRGGGLEGSPAIARL